MIVRNTGLTEPSLSAYCNLSETEVKRINEPLPGLFIAESPNVIERALDAGYEPVSMLVCEDEFKGQAEKQANRMEDKPVYVVKKDEFAKITGANLTRGALSAMKRKKLPTVDDIIKDAKRIAVLEDVVNPTNLGAIVRSAAALGMDAVLFSEGCTDPLYRRAIRVSMGTVFQIPWTFFNGDVNKLKEKGFLTLAMALRDDTLDIKDSKIKDAERVAILLGSEGPGLTDETIANCDYTVKIPMYNGVDSLNVAAASAVAFYEIRRVENGTA